MYQYYAFGYHVKSDIALPELLPFTDQPDIDEIVTITLGSVPESLTAPHEEGARFQAKTGQLLLHVDCVARFLIEGGTTITIDVIDDCDEDSIRLFLLGSCFGALMQQQGRFVLHGSAVVKDDTCLVFLGRSGIGKSTLAQALCQTGFQMLSDDLCSISFENNQALLHPAYPQNKLWPDSLDALAIESDGLRLLRPTMRKKAIPNPQNFCASPQAISKLYVLAKSKEDRFERELLKGALAIKALQENSYRKQYINGLGLNKPHFHQVSRTLSSGIAVEVVSRPDHLSRLSELVDLIRGIDL
ncbi:HPr kinase [Oleiphilus messinensis]|uniref:HPr kinase n=1 Tax=Oleiphilus messinensis TaxID=141451 RepID=A0A1Y0I419_9GAMM|nr:hypothetical protein [Oleiphilus messinensis]ARU55248.1 HPr kinase [Oleiphilus messinensis]